MPNHIHGILIIVGATLAVALKKSAIPNKHEIQNNSKFKERAPARDAPTKMATIGEIIGSYKSLCVTEWLEYISSNKLDYIGKFWQRNYYEHIIRDEPELNKIREYIINNPLKWLEDEYYV